MQRALASCASSTGPWASPQCCAHPPRCRHRVLQLPATSIAPCGRCPHANSAPTRQRRRGAQSSALPATGPLADVAPGFDWSEEAVWRAALQGASAAPAPDPAAPLDPAAASLASLRRGLAGLHVLLPDLEPHWREQLAVQRHLAGVELLLRGAGPDAAAAAAAPLPPSPPPWSPEAAPDADSPQAQAAPAAAALAFAPPDPHRDLFTDAQAAAVRLQELGPFFRQYGTRTTGSCYTQAMWVVGDALGGAARNYCGPGSVLLRDTDLAAAAAAARALRRAHEAQLGVLIRTQVALAGSLPGVALRLIALREAAGEQGLDVGHLAATNLQLLLALPAEPGPPYPQQDT